MGLNFKLPIEEHLREPQNFLQFKFKFWHIFGIFCDLMKNGGHYARAVGTHPDHSPGLPGAEISPL